MYTTMAGTRLSSYPVRNSRRQAAVQLSRPSNALLAAGGMRRPRTAGPGAVVVLASRSEQDSGAAAAAAADASAGGSSDVILADLTATAEEASEGVVEEVAVAAEAAATTAEAAAAEVEATSALPSVSAPPPSGVVPTARQFVKDYPLAGYSLASLLAFLGITFAVAVVRTALRGFSPTAKRGRTVNKNKAVVDELAKYLPGNRAGLSGGTINGLRLKTGFSPVEIFRKYLWFLLRERKFDTDAVADVVALRAALRLDDGQVAAALRERATRIYDKYGNVMLDTEGMSAAGVERKATARALFSKLQFLVECEELLSAEAAAGVDLREIFGATEDDASRLRIASLYEVDLDTALGLPDATPGSQEAGPPSE